MILSIFVLVLAVGAGTLYYFLNIKEYKTADTKVDEIVKSDYKVKLPGEENTMDGSGEQAKEQGVNETAETAESGIAKGSSGSYEANRSQNVKPTANSILEKYQRSFKDLEGQADGKLNSLLSHAYSEYQTKKSKSEDVSYFYFYSKYNGAAKTLEASTDNSFYYIYNSLVKELEKYGFSSKEAKPIKDHYLSLKKQRRSSLMNKAVDYLK
jgi:ribosomal protein S17E